MYKRRETKIEAFVFVISWHLAHIQMQSAKQLKDLKPASTYIEFTLSTSWMIWHCSHQSFNTLTTSHVEE